MLSHVLLRARRILAHALSCRPYSTSSLPYPRVESISVSARSNGAFTIDVFHSTKPAQPVLIYLPSGPLIPEHKDEEDRIVATLSRASNATIARINYRASVLHQYPTPIHDTLLAYEWIKDNLLHHGVPRPVLPRLGVCGELMGASLAVMLGLTECRLGETRIGAASVNNPIVDWVFADELPAAPISELPEPVSPEETAFPADQDFMSVKQETKSAPVTIAKPQKRPAKPPPLTAWQLHGDNTVIPTVTLSGERDVLFSKPEHYFDRFASPLHWFRSPHGTLLSPKDDDTLASEQPDGPIDYEAQMSLLHFQSLDSTRPPVDLPTLVRCRAYARMYPPAGVRLSLPAWRITAGSQSPLLDQSTELARMLKRSIARQTLKNKSGRSRYHDAGEKDKFEAHAETMVDLNIVKGIGLWTQQDADSSWEADVERTGLWMKEALRPEF